jgi:hypothetical protein
MTKRLTSFLVPALRGIGAFEVYRVQNVLQVQGRQLLIVSMKRQRASLKTMVTQWSFVTVVTNSYTAAQNSVNLKHSVALTRIFSLKISNTRMSLLSNSFCKYSMK